MSAGHREFPTRRVEDGVGRDGVESLAEETPVALLYNGHPHAVMMATPLDLEDFALGFSLTEAIVGRADELRVVDCLETADGISLQMHVPQAAFDALQLRGRSLTGRTGCGLCGSDTLASAIRPVRRVEGLPADGARLVASFEAMQARQPLNARTGAVHAAAVVAADGRCFVREDVGRHNAIDKAIGAALRADAVPRELLVTSRASYEVVHKAAAVGIGLVAAISAPTALAVRLAGEAGLTLVGFARDARHTIYAGPDAMRL
jgi:formate dehydrogenase accessory protein FdhD